MPHPRLVRLSAPHGRLALQERDLRILELVYTYRFLDSRTIGLLLHHHGSAWALQGRLKKLFEHRYLDRPRRQAAVWMMDHEPHYLIYALGREGAKVLAERYGVPLEQSRWTQMNHEVGDVHLRHTLGVARFRAALRLAIPDDAPDAGRPEYATPYLLRWRQGQAIKVRVRLADRNGSHQPFVLTPDALFGIQAATPPPNRSYFFLEYERSANLKRFLRAKGLAYRALWEQQKHEEQFGIKGFRALVIATTERKHETLRRMLRVWLTTIPPHLHGMWLLTSETRYCLDDPQSVLRPIWQTAEEEQCVALLD